MTDRARSGTVLVLAVVASIGCGCSEDSAGAPSSGGSGGSAGASAGSGGALTGGTGAVGVGGTGAAGGNGGCGPQPLPKEVPPGWQEYTGYSCGCRFYVPGPSAKPLDPVEWEPCPQPGPIGVSCQRMKTPWTSGLAMGTFPRFWFDAKASSSFLQFDRYPSFSERYRLVADADGAVRFAALELTPPDSGCGMQPSGIQGARYLFGVLGDSMSGPIQGAEGFLAGEFGALPSASFKAELEPNHHTAWRMTSEWIIRWKSGLFGRRFDAPNQEVTMFDPSQDVEGLPPFNVQGIGETVLFGVGSGVSSGVMAWTQAAGVTPVVRYVGDANRAAGNFGADSADMVWTYGEGAFTTAEGKFTTQSVMTAPFSTDASIVQKTARRLRSDPGTFSPWGFAVGSGYAARKFGDLTNGLESASADLLVVRLSDGVSWQVEMPPATQGAAFMTALGFSKDEVFASAQFKDDSTTIVRIRLDSLGPGIPPD